ncbi:MAG: response regulator [Alteromonadaceae bacterium]|nr:response regulator [Alteromonadaceae bacterium]
MKVLVIDDSKLARSAIINLVKQTVPKATFAEAEDGDIALRMIGEDNYDLYTIDYTMPGANGEIVALAALTASPRAKICMLTSATGGDMQARCERIGVKFLSKENFESDLISFITS